MKKSATEVMQDILFAATIDTIEAMKTASKGLPNNLLRDLNAIHANTTFADLPPEVQQAITAGVRSALARLLREGYSVAPAGSQQPQRPPRPSGEGGQRHGPRSGSGRDERGPRRPGGGPGRGPGGGSGRGPGRGPGAGPGGGGRPPRKPQSR